MKSVLGKTFLPNQCDQIELPSLKERKQDIPLLCYHFLKRFTQFNQKEIHTVSPEAMQALVSREYQEM